MSLGDPADADRPVEEIGCAGAVARKLTELALGEEPGAVHLEEPILGGDEPLGAKRVGQRQLRVESVSTLGSKWGRR